MVSPFTRPPKYLECSGPRGPEVLRVVALLSVVVAAAPTAGGFAVAALRHRSAPRLWLHSFPAPWVLAPPAVALPF